MRIENIVFLKIYFSKDHKSKPKNMKSESFMSKKDTAQCSNWGDFILQVSGGHQCWIQGTDEAGCSDPSFSCSSRPTFSPLTTLLWKNLPVCLHIWEGNILNLWYWDVFYLCISTYFYLTFFKYSFLLKARVRDSCYPIFKRLCR